VHGTLRHAMDGTDRATDVVRRTIFRLLAVAGVVVAAVVVIIVLPEHMVTTKGLAADQQADHVDTARTALIQTLGGLGLLGGLFYTASTVRLNREGQITDRFSRAVDQLGSAAVDTRIGGIYALERIMRDSSADHGPVVEILTAFVREHATDRGAATENDQSTAGAGPPAVGLPTLPADIQAAMTVLGRRPPRPEQAPLDLRDTDLRGVRAHAARLAGAILTGAKFDHADLGQADLRGARLRKASLHAAWLRAANLRRASLRHADLSQAYLLDADLRESDHTGANLDAIEDAGVHW
jgi:Pentapeptide repeats (8 copies)